MEKLSNIELLLNDSRGIYIPRDFYEGFDLVKWNVSNLNLLELSDPYNESYWDVWDMVLNTAYFELNGKRYSLYQDGDLWAVAYDHLTDEEKESLGFEDY